MHTRTQCSPPRPCLHFLWKDLAGCCLHGGGACGHACLPAWAARACHERADSASQPADQWSVLWLRAALGWAHWGLCFALSRAIHTCVCGMRCSGCARGTQRVERCLHRVLAFSPAFGYVPRTYPATCCMPHATCSTAGSLLSTAPPAPLPGGLRRLCLLCLKLCVHRLWQPWVRPSCTRNAVRRLAGWGGGGERGAGQTRILPSAGAKLHSPRKLVTSRTQQQP